MTENFRRLKNKIDGRNTSRTLLSLLESVVSGETMVLYDGFVAPSAPGDIVRILSHSVGTLSLDVDDVVRRLLFEEMARADAECPGSGFFTFLSLCEFLLDARVDDENVISHSSSCDLMTANDICLRIFRSLRDVSLTQQNDVCSASLNAASEVGHLGSVSFYESSDTRGCVSIVLTSGCKFDCLLSTKTRLGLVYRARRLPYTLQMPRVICVDGEIAPMSAADRLIRDADHIVSTGQEFVLVCQSIDPEIDSELLRRFKGDVHVVVTGASQMGIVTPIDFATAAGCGVVTPYFGDTLMSFDYDKRSSTVESISLLDDGVSVVNKATQRECVKKASTIRRSTGAEVDESFLDRARRLESNCATVVIPAGPSFGLLKDRGVNCVRLLSDTARFGVVDAVDERSATQRIFARACRMLRLGKLPSRSFLTGVSRGEELFKVLTSLGVIIEI